MEMDTSTSNTAQSKINPFIKFIWEEQHQLEFVTPLYANPLLFIIYIDMKQALNSWLLKLSQVTHNNQVSCIGFSSTVYTTITIWATWKYRECKILLIDGSFNWSFFEDVINIWRLNRLKLKPIQLLETVVSSSTSS